MSSPASLLEYILPYLEQEKHDPLSASTHVVMLLMSQEGGVVQHYTTTSEFNCNGQAKRPTI